MEDKNKKKRNKKQTNFQKRSNKKHKENKTYVNIQKEWQQIDNRDGQTSLRRKGYKGGVKNPIQEREENIPI